MSTQAAKLRILENAEYGLNGPDITRPPVDLAEDAAAIWRSLAPEMADSGLLTALDLPLFRILCDDLALSQEAERRLCTEGRVLVSKRSGLPRRNPWYNIRLDADAQIVRLGRQFGLTPTARGGMKFEADPTPERDAFEDL